MVAVSSILQLNDTPIIYVAFLVFGQAQKGLKCFEQAGQKLAVEKLFC